MALRSQHTSLSLLPVGFGLMNFTSLPAKKFSQDQFNGTFKQVLEGSGASSTRPLFINSGEFYGNPDRHEGLKVLGNFFDAFPEYADSVFVSIKAGTTPTWAPDSSAKNLNKAVDVIDKYLQPLYKARQTLPKLLDMFTVARIGKEPVEEIIETMEAHKANKKIGSICLSEISAPTLKRALAQGSVDAVEIEFSLFHREAADNGLFETCLQHKIPAVCYSPLGKGVLVGQKSSDLTKGDFRLTFDKFKDPEVVKHNETLVTKLRTLAEDLKTTPAQLALSWITTLSGNTVDGIEYPQLIPIPGSTSAQRQLSNLDVTQLSPETLATINEILKTFKTAGHRYNKVVDAYNSR